MSIEENTTAEDNAKIEENSNPEENHDIVDDIKKIFENYEYAYPLEDIIEEIKNLGYKNPGMIITNAIQDDLLYVDSIEDDGIVYLALIEQDEEE